MLKELRRGGRPVPCRPFAGILLWRSPRRRRASVHGARETCSTCRQLARLSSRTTAAYLLYQLQEVDWKTVAASRTSGWRTAMV
jgi:hypothetical protein